MERKAIYFSYIDLLRIVVFITLQLGSNLKIVTETNSIHDFLFRNYFVIICRKQWPILIDVINVIKFCGRALNRWAFRFWVRPVWRWLLWDFAPCCAVLRHVAPCCAMLRYVYQCLRGPCYLRHKRCEYGTWELAKHGRTLSGSAGKRARILVRGMELVAEGGPQYFHILGTLFDVNISKLILHG
jgi:hypothetical protein